MMRSVQSLFFGAALLVACGDGDPATTGLSVGGLTESTTASTGTTTTGVPTTGAPTTGSGSASAGTTAVATTDPGTTDPGTTDPGTTDPGTTGPGTTSSSSSSSTGTTEPVDTTQGTTGSTGSTTGPFCGDGLLDPGEACDGLDLAGATCISLGFAQGTLACDDTCEFDVSGCMGMPECAVPLMPPGAPMCPPACTGGCDMATHTCAINCGGNVCDNLTVTCPDDWACEIACTGTTPCDNTTFNCPAHYACDITCQGTSACDFATFNCGDGPCHVYCAGTSPCESSTMNCGLGDGQFECGQATKKPVPMLVPDPNSTCLCQPMGC